MRLIRNNIFETNSSSTHCIVIAKEYKKHEYDSFSSWDTDYEFGRFPFKICDHWDEKLAYMYMVIRNRSEEGLETFKQYTIELFEELKMKNNHNNITPEKLFDMLEEKDEYSFSVGYVDHDYEVPSELVERCITDKEFVKRFIFSVNSYITCSGDEYEGYYIKTIGFSHDYGYEEDNLYKERLKEYSEKYDVYFKGN